MKFHQHLYQLSEKFPEINYLNDNFTYNDSARVIQMPTLEIKGQQVTTVGRRVPTSDMDLIEKLSNFSREKKSEEDSSYLLRTENNQLYELRNNGQPSFREIKDPLLKKMLLEDLK